jgi:hypothetical protein
MSQSLDTVSTDTVLRWIEELTRLAATDDADRVDQLDALERLKAAAAAAQHRVTVDLDASQRQAQRDAGVPERKVGAGIAAQVALARRESPTRGSRHLGLAHVLVEEMPRTLAALERGDTTEWRATLVARETACLSRADRRSVDRELASRPGGLAALGDRATEAETRRIAYRLDPAGVVRRAARAESDRRVTLRPAPDTMTILSGLLPVRQGVAVLASLTRHANTLRSSGDSRSRGQIMADTLVERIIGQAHADAVPVEVQLVMTDETLLRGGAEPARVEGCGPVPAALARSWVRDTGAEVWLRRLYVAPGTGTLVAMDSHRRTFRGLLRRFLVLRDEACRTPWCGAPIRHADHLSRAADGGRTTVANAQGLCEACNYAKEGAGWRARASGEAVEITTPTGHRYRSRPPALAPPRSSPASRIELYFTEMVLAA